MKVTVIQKSGYGTRDGVWHDCGSVFELPDDVARKLAVYGIVALLPEQKPAAKKAEVEAAVPEPPANTAARSGKARGRPRKSVS